MNLDDFDPITPRRQRVTDGVVLFCRLYVINCQESHSLGGEKNCGLLVTRVCYQSFNLIESNLIVTIVNSGGMQLVDVSLCFGGKNPKLGYCDFHEN